MDDIWFVEVPHLGGWTPQLHHGDRPSTTGSEGTRRRFRAEPRKVKAEHTHLPLDILAAIYGKDRP